MHLKSRICLLGSSINTRTEKHGDDDVPAIDIPITGFALVGAELAEITGDVHAHRALFDKSKNPVEPIFNCFRPLALVHKFEGCTARFILGLGREELVLADCKVARVKLEPNLGGLTSADFLIQSTPDDLAAMARLMAFMGHDIELEVELGNKAEKAKANQQNLALDDESDDQQEAA
jgi:hypothetical protein